MNNSGKILDAMEGLLALFSFHCSERTTLDRLSAMVIDDRLWPEAHKLFQSIRKKNLEAERQHNDVLKAQYCFEEVCAKTLYNLSGSSAPFDADSPYWIIPNALTLARHLNINEAEILRITA